MHTSDKLFSTAIRKCSNDFKLVCFSRVRVQITVLNCASRTFVGVMCKWHKRVRNTYCLQDLQSTGVVRVVIRQSTDVNELPTTKSALTVFPSTLGEPSVK